MEPPDRLRPHPRDRWPDPTQVIDLASAVAGLRSEPHQAIAGHHQIALGRHGPVTLLLFVFEQGGLLNEHQAEGVVTIQVLRGALEVAAGEAMYPLRAGQLLLLPPRIPHSLRALEPSETLVTVHKHTD